jgi:hypothetical protein
MLPVIGYNLVQHLAAGLADRLLTQAGGAAPGNGATPAGGPGWRGG